MALNPREAWSEAVAGDMAKTELEHSSVTIVVVDETEK